MKKIAHRIIFALWLLSLAVAGRAEGPADAFEYDDHDRRDPFWPLVNAQGMIVQYGNDLMVSDLILEGVMLGVSSQESVAIINGKIVKVNDTVGVFRIKEIKPGAVILQKDTEEYVLNLKKEADHE